jgi:putative SOS response-associated peptidase YedK
VGKRLVCCGKDDQCKIRNSEHEACIPGCTEISQVPDSRGRVLRVEENREIEAAILFRSQRRRVVRFRRNLGLLEERSGNAIETCSILTTTPNAVTAVVHDRMPVILDPDSYDLWLDPGMKDVSLVAELLKPCDPGIIRSYPVSSRVNQVVNDDAACSALVELVETQNQLLF